LAFREQYGQIEARRGFARVAGLREENRGTRLVLLYPFAMREQNAKIVATSHVAPIAAPRVKG